MAVLIANEVEQEVFEAEANKIVNEGKDYSVFRRYMEEPCEDVAVCDACMCPHDSRLDEKEQEDAQFACEVAVAAHRGRKSTPLFTFAKQHCSYWHQEQSRCSILGTCLIGISEDCEYFRKAVWGIGDPNYPYATHADGYLKRRAEYLAINPLFSGVRRAERYCNCGQALQTGKHLCDKCSGKKIHGQSR